MFKRGDQTNPAGLAEHGTNLHSSCTRLARPHRLTVRGGSLPRPPRCQALLSDAFPPTQCVLGDTALSFHPNGRLGNHPHPVPFLLTTGRSTLANLLILSEYDIYLPADRYLPISIGPCPGEFSECAFQRVIRSAFVMHGYKC